METLIIWVLLLLSMAITGLRADTAPVNGSSLNVVPNNLSGDNYTQVVLNNNKRHSGYYRQRGGGGGGGGGGSFGWGWGGGGGGGGGGRGRGGGGGGGWGWGGGGGGWYKWGCGGGGRKGKGRRSISDNRRMHRNRVMNNGDYKLGEFAQCKRRGRCKGMRLDCPLHCGGPCFYDCQFMCRAHCRRPS